MLIKLYNDNPNVREVRRIADALRDGEVLILPTDTLYAFACSMEHKRSVEEIAQLKGFKIKQAKYSMLCSDLSMASEYLRAMDRDTFALLISPCLREAMRPIPQAPLSPLRNRSYRVRSGSSAPRGSFAPPL